MPDRGEGRGRGGRAGGRPTTRATDGGARGQTGIALHFSREGETVEVAVAMGRIFTMIVSHTHSSTSFLRAP